VAIVRSVRPQVIIFSNFVLFLLLSHMVVYAAPMQITPAATTTSVSASPTTITLGATVTLTATVVVVAPGTGTPTGLVTFFDGVTPIGSGILNQVGGNDQATFATSLLSVGIHSITAIYDGDANFSGSPLSAAITETVQLRTSTTAVSLNPTTVVVNQSTTATITVTDFAPAPVGVDLFSGTGAPATGRTGFTSTLFEDGQVLIAGGTDANGKVLQSAEIYTVAKQSFTATGNLNISRSGATATLLLNGKILIAGGSSDGTANGALNSAELFDPVTGTFTRTTGNMNAARLGATATLLDNGQVLLAGGANAAVLNSAELYDPVADTFTATGNLNSARTGAVAVLLNTGKVTGTVLVAGGSSDGTANGALTSAELFDPTTGTFTASASNLATGRWQPEAALLLSGKVLLAGGQNSTGAMTSADLYDPATDSFTPSAQSMAQARANGSAIALPTGMVLLAGGTTSTVAELYDADSDRFDPTGSLQQPDIGLVSTLLNDGQVLVAGLTTAATPQPDAEIYIPSFNPLGTVIVVSSDNTDAVGAACVLTPGSGTAASTCTTTVTPSVLAAGTHTITGTYSANTVHSGSSNTASLTVTIASPPTISKAFSSGAVALGGTIGLSFTISNPNPAATLTGIQFTDSLPAGLQVANPNNLFSNCGGAVTAAPGSSSITLSGGSVAPIGPAPLLVKRGVKLHNSRSLSATPTPASGECVITVSVSAQSLGQQPNITGTISAAESGPGTTSNTATVNVIQPPAVTKAFGAMSIPFDGTISLTFNFSNPTAATEFVNVTLTDPLPAGLVVASPNGVGGTCVTNDGGTVIAPPNATSVLITAFNLAPGASCTATVSVAGLTPGVKNNTTMPVIASFDDGSGNFIAINGAPASAGITVQAPPNANLAIAKTHNGNFVASTNQTYTITVSNGTIAGPTIGTVTVVDNLPSNTLTPTAIAGTGWNCTLSSLTCTRNDSLAANASYPPITLTVNVPAASPTSVTNSATVSGGGDPNSHTATDPTTIVPPPPAAAAPLQVSLSASTVTINVGATQFVNMSVQSSPSEGSVQFSCSGLPFGATCNFNPPSTSALTANVTLGISTTMGTGIAQQIPLPAGPGRIPPLYGAVLPIMGMVGIFGHTILLRKRGKTFRLRWTMLFAGMTLAIMSALIGCGGTPTTPSTPKGSFPITVTAKSQATGDSSSAIITVVVPQ
jgi:uncharacterized repeat protein (TIGR01451 family)